MSIEHVKHGVAQGSALFESVPVDEIAKRWDGLDIPAAQQSLYDTMGIIRGLQEGLSRMMVPVAVTNECAEQGSVLFQHASEGTQNFDMLDVLTSAELLTSSSAKLGLGVATMEKLCADMASALAGATILLGKVVDVHEQIAAEKLPEIVATTPEQVIQHAATYIREH